MPYVYSTMAAPVRYMSYVQAEPGTPRIAVSGVTIAGGVGVASKHLVTPRGVVTEVTDEELAFLEQDEVFKTHLAAGHVTVSKGKTDPEKAAADMEGRDISAPLVPEDFDEDDTVQPSEDDKPKKKKASKRK